MRASARAEQAAWLTVTFAARQARACREWRRKRQRLPNRNHPRRATSAARRATAPQTPLVSFEQLRAAGRFLAARPRRGPVRRRLPPSIGEDWIRCPRALARRRSCPSCGLRAVRNTDQALRWVPTTDDPYRVTQADGAGMILEASARSDSNRLLFARRRAFGRAAAAARRRGAAQARGGACRRRWSACFAPASWLCATDPNDPRSSSGC